MEQGSGGTRFTGAALVRLLAQLGAADARGARPVLAERLSHWLGWTDAIALSGALGTAAGRGAAITAIAAQAERAEFTRVRTLLAQSIANDRELAPPKSRGTLPAAEPEFAHFRRRYLARQQALELAIADLRGRVRAAVAAASAPLARLAAVDTVMEQVLGAQEQRLLSGVPALLERRFEQLHFAATPAWLDTFCQDLRAVLLAELALRLQPVEGLLAALDATACTGAAATTAAPATTDRDRPAPRRPSPPHSARPTRPRSAPARRP